MYARRFGTLVHILFLLLQKYPSLEFPLLDPFGLRQELTDQDKQSGDDAGDRCLFTEMCCRVHSCPLSLPATL